MNGTTASQKLESAQGANRLISTNHGRKRKRLTHERLKELLAYNPKTGKFYHRTTRGRGLMGLEAGSAIGDGYFRVRVDQTNYLTHRLAWFYVHGYLPENQIDHIDRDPGNNRIDNLREVSQVCNLRNCGNPVDNTSGVKGVCRRRGRKWHVQIAVYGHRYHIGYFDDFDEAVCYRLAAEQCLNWEGCDSSSPAYCYVQENITGVKT